MPWAAAITAGVGLVGGVMAADAQSEAASTAAGAQTAASQAGIDEQRRQFDAVRGLLSPYVSAGAGALGQQQSLLGISGPAAQQQAIDALRAGPQFQSMLQQGETSILQNAAATGGLRGGNTQAALGQFSPQLLSQLINQQYSNLGGLTSLGQNAAAGVGNAGLQTGTNVANLLAQGGAAQAGGALAQGRASAQGINAITGGIGQFAGMGGFGNLFAPPVIDDGYSMGLGSAYGGTRAGL